MSGVLTLTAGLLQLIVPSYAFRLVRRFGAQRVGWFIVIAFVSLAMLHLLAPLKPVGTGPAPDLTLNIVYALGSMLLLIGMGHMETLFSEREQTHRKEEMSRENWELLVQQETSELTRANQELLGEIARCQEHERVLAESEAQYRHLFIANPQPIWIFDLRTCRLLAANNAALLQYGFTLEEFMALNTRDLLSPAAVAGFEQDIFKPCLEVEARGVWQHCRSDGTLIDVEMTALDLKYDGAPARLILATEMTRRQREELEARKALKMEIISQVTGGAAGHFSPIFAGIESKATRLLPELQDPECAEQLKLIAVAANRGNSFTRQMLAVSGQHPMHPEVLDLNELIRNMNHLLGRLIGEHITLQCDYGPHLTPLLADPRLIEHVIVNLVVNARDAMPDGGTVILATVTVHVEDFLCAGRAKAGQFVRLTLRDTGCGITPEVQSRLFEPFFTTKVANKAAGLGLASAYGFVKQHGGWIEFTTDPGVGTEFRVFLPCAPATAILAHTESRTAKPLNKGTIMVVEPEDRARGLARFVFNRHGYRVIEADCGSVALLLWGGQSRNIDLLFTNLSLPGEISGHELAEQLQRFKPGLKVVYSCNSENEAQHLKPPAGVKLIAKPYTPDRLLQEVQASLDPES